MTTEAERRGSVREDREQELVTVFLGDEILFGEFLDESRKGVGARFENKPPVTVGDAVQIMVQSRLLDAQVRSIRETASGSAVVGFELVAAH